MAVQLSSPHLRKSKVYNNVPDRPLSSDTGLQDLRISESGVSVRPLPIMSSRARLFVRHAPTPYLARS